MKTAAIYARVSSDKQREENTIASQTAALIAFAGERQFEVPREWIFEDDGYSGASLIRPGLERVRDLAAEGLIQAVLVYAPDRLSRRYRVSNRLQAASTSYGAPRRCASVSHAACSVATAARRAGSAPIHASTAARSSGPTVPSR